MRHAVLIFAEPGGAVGAAPRRRDVDHIVIGRVGGPRTVPVVVLQHNHIVRVAPVQQPHAVQIVAGS